MTSPLHTHTIAYTAEPATTDCGCSRTCQVTDCTPTATERTTSQVHGIQNFGSTLSLTSRHEAPTCTSQTRNVAMTGLRRPWCRRITGMLRDWLPLGAALESPELLQPDSTNILLNCRWIWGKSNPNLRGLFRPRKCFGEGEVTPGTCLQPAARPLQRP